MPRARQPPAVGGPDLQPVRDIPNQPYGRGVDNRGLQGAGLPENVVPGASVQDPPLPFVSDGLLDIARGASGPLEQPLGAPDPSTRPVTDGLPSGPGRGSEALPAFSRDNPATRLMEDLAESLGSGRLARMARHSRS